MLEYLRVQNLAIIEDVELEFGPGLTVVTGETGAGKSILVGALAALRGGRMTREQVRDGADSALLEAILGAKGGTSGGTDPGPGGASEVHGDLAAEDSAASGPAHGQETLTLVRAFSAAGRGRARIDGELVPLAELARRVAPLLDISGQHEGQSLTDASTHLGLLDAAGVDPARIRAVREAVSEIDRIAEELGRLSLDDRERAARLDLLRYQLEEIEALDPVPGEEAPLEAERRRLAAARTLAESTLSCHALLYEDEGAAVDRLAQATRLLGPGAAADPALQDALERLEEAQALVEDVARELLAYGERVAEDPARLAEVEDRLDALRRLGRKHRTDAAGLAALRESFRQEIEALQGADARIEALEVALREVRERGRGAADALSRARREAARRLAGAVSENLQRLGMPGARFEVRITERQARQGDPPERIFEGRVLGPAGWDRVSFYVAPNPGEDALPLARTASGGELSRVMLALKLVLAARDRVETYVFDEVDAGIGGATADAVGLALAEVARHRQVICITHLAAIAAFADHHFRVSKRTRGGRTVAEIRPLGERERVDEVARMLGGARVTPQTRGAAEDLIGRARERVARLGGDAASEGRRRGRRRASGGASGARRGPRGARGGGRRTGASPGGRRGRSPKE